MPDEAAAADALLVGGSITDDALGRGVSHNDTGDSSIGSAKVRCSQFHPEMNEKKGV